MPQTKLANLVDPQVMADMVSAKLPKKIKFSPIARIDTTLVGRPGSTIVVPKYAYIGDAEDVAEGVAMGTTVLTASTTEAKVKKAGKAVELTDESVLSGYGDPMGTTVNQIAMSIAAKVDNDCYDALCDAPIQYDGAATDISYSAVVAANSKFDDESDGALTKILFINPAQEATLLNDADFKSNDKYPLNVIMNGTIGSIAGAQVVKSKKVKLVKYEKDNEAGTITIVADTVEEDATKKHLSTILPNYAGKLAVGDKVKSATTPYYSIMRTYMKENDLSYNDSFAFLKECMEKDGFFKLIGLDKVMEGMTEKEVQPEVETKKIPQDHKKKQTGTK